jgi:hypothetical protein
VIAVLLGRKMLEVSGRFPRKYIGEELQFLQRSQN